MPSFKVPSKCWVILTSIAFLCGSPAFANDLIIQQHQKALSNTSNRLQQLVKKRTIDSAVIGIVDKSGLIWHKSFGYANHEQKIPATENTVYRVGSLSKLLTATAILQLEEEGIIDIDQAVSAYIPRFYYKSRFDDSGVITARNLLTHHSGLPSNINKGHWTEERFTDLVERLRTEYTSYPTDFILNYSNVGYSLLGTIIEENTDYLFEDYIQKHIFDPLDMKSSNFAPYGYTGDNAATGYKNHVAQENMPVRDIPALGLNSNIIDLSHYLAAIFNKGQFNHQKILQPDNIDSMFVSQNSQVNLDLDHQIGLPWFLSTVENEQPTLIAEHGGTTINFSSQIMLAPDHQLGVIILSNTSQVNSILNGIAQKLLHKLLDQPEPIIAYIPENSQQQAHQVGNQEKNRYIAKSGIIELDREASQLCDCQTNRRLNLVPLPDGWFGISPDNQKLTSKITEQVIDGKEVIVLEHNGKTQRIGSRYQQKESRFNWQQHYGNYEVVNPDDGFPVTDIRIYDENNMTYMCYRMPKLSDKLIVLPITPVSEIEAITEGLGRSKGETVYSQLIDGDKHIIYSGYIARKLSN